MEKLTNEEKTFLNLPDSKLAIRLHEKSKESSERRTLLQKILGTSKRRVIALSAFIAAVIPLYELNKSAIDFTFKRRDLAATLATAEDLIAIDAMDAAKAELEKAEKIDDSNTKLLQLQSLIELEESLRLSQDVRSLRQLEVRYKKILPKFSQGSYLLGTAFIGWDLEKAEDYLDQAEKLNKGKNPSLRIRILSGRIWILSRRFQKTQDPKLLVRADEYYAEAMKIVEAKSPRDFSKDLIAVYHHYSFIASARENDNLPTEGHSSLELSKLSFSAALKTGSHLLISKAAKGLAEKHKDSDTKAFDEAKALLNLAIQYAEEAEDTRGLYFGNYTLGQVEHQLGDHDESRKAFTKALEGAIGSTDLRIEIFSRICLATACLLEKDPGTGKTHLQIAKTLAGETGDEYGVWELEIIELFYRLSATKDFSAEKLSDAFLELKTRIPENFDIHLDACDQWSQILKSAEEGKLAEKPSDFEFDTPLEEYAYKKIQKSLSRR